MTLVVDASALVDLIVGRLSPSEASEFDADLAAPDLMLAEVANGIRRSERRGLLSTHGAEARLLELLGLPVALHPTRDVLERAFALRSTVTIHDACYVALAEQLGCGLLTSDRRLAGAPGVTVPVTVV